MLKEQKLLFFVSSREDACAECGATISLGDLITLQRPVGVLCLSCSDLDHLVFLPSGNTALTARARKFSPLSVVVMKFSKSRKRNERQGVLVSAEGSERAEKECLSDEEQRASRRARERIRSEKRDGQYIKHFATMIRRFYPGCSEEIASRIASHACEKYSGRVGRSAGAKNLDENFVRLAVKAHIRHAETSYDELLAKGVPRDLAREQIRGQLEECLLRWEGGNVEMEGSSLKKRQNPSGKM